ncbi:MAG: AAA family ATPase [Opitutales bacterium]
MGALLITKWIAPTPSTWSTGIRKKNRKPLVIRGARQVGKSTLVRRFAESNELQLFEVNLERHPNLRSTAESLDPKKILREVEFICGKGAIHPPAALLFLMKFREYPFCCKRFATSMKNTRIYRSSPRAPYSSLHCATI